MHFKGIQELKQNEPNLARKIMWNYNYHGKTIVVRAVKGYKRSQVVLPRGSKNAVGAVTWLFHEFTI